jgi:phosphate/sulfate permease
MISALTPVAAQDLGAGMFLGYIAALGFSGLLLLVLAALPFPQSTANRVINGLIGVAMLGYGLYLFFMFDGGEFRVFYYVFLVPIFAVVHTVKGIKAMRAAKATQPELG